MENSTKYKRTVKKRLPSGKVSKGRMGKLLLLILPLLLLLYIVACKKEQPQMVELNQGCDCANEVSAEFLMEELATTIGSQNEAKYRTNTDTIIFNKNVRFRAKDSTVDCTWYIGNEILNEKQVVRFFDNTLINQTLPIILVAKKKPNTICFPNDDGYDSIVKYLTVSNKSWDDVFDLPNHLFEGMFRFKDSLGNYPGDSVDLKIELKYWGEDALFYDRMKITHLGSQDSVTYLSSDRRNYRKIWLDGYYLTPSFHYLPNGRVEFLLNQHPLTPERPSIYFIGRKLN